jgi:hypothetical protein
VLVAAFLANKRMAALIADPNLLRPPEMVQGELDFGE